MPATRRQGDFLYLQKIGERWYARIPVPANLRQKLGPFYRRALGTTDLKEARRRRGAVLEAAQALFEAHRADTVRRSREKAGDATYAEFRAKLAAAGPSTVINLLDGEEMFNPAVDRFADLAEESGRPDLERAVADHVAGWESVTETLKSYLTANPKRSATTHANYETTVKLWRSLREDRPIHNVTRRQALEWLEVVAEGKARDTVKRYATVMRHLWDWAHRREEAAERPRNPFGDLLKALGTGVGRPTKGHEFYEDVELVKAYSAVINHNLLRPLMLISAYTGFRLSECLRAERREVCGLDCFVLSGGKTTNAGRVVPAHPRLNDIVVPPGGKSSTLSVEYGRAMRRIEVRKGLTFHSIRKAFATGLERAGCPEAVAARLLGHAPLSITYGIYSKGRDAAELKSWVEKISLPI